MTAAKSHTFGQLTFRTAILEAPAVNGGPFNSAPSMTVAVGSDDEVTRRLRLDERDGLYHVGTPVNFDSDGARFFLCYAEDCFSPPLFVVRADDESEALDALVSAHCQTFELDADAVAEREADGLGETVGYTDTGLAYDSETLRLRPLTLRTVNFA